MADIVVIGAGIGGLAVSARLAKLGHRVTVCERSCFVGGAVRAVEQAGFRWDAGATSLTLPATVRDLFRKSGRPLERYVDLRLRTPARRHVFSDGSVMDLPTGGRGEQTRAVDAGLGAGIGREWTAFVDAQIPAWEVLRREVLDREDGGARLGNWPVARRLRSRLSLETLLRREMTDERLRQLATYPFVLAGSRPQDIPAYAAVHAYVERSSGVWSLPNDGLATLTDALLARLYERGVTVRCDTPVVQICVEHSGVTGVETASGERLAAQAVVTDVSPRMVFEDLVDDVRVRHVRRLFGAATPAVPVAVTHIGLRANSDITVADRPEEVVLHGEPLLVLNAAGSAPPRHRAWTIWQRGACKDDVLAVLADRGLDVRNDVVRRIDRNPAELAASSGGSPDGWVWAGYRANARRSGVAAPIPGLHLLGAGMHPGPSIPYVVWGAAHVAARIGKT